MANFFTPIAGGFFRDLFEHFYQWGPGTISIVVSLLVFGLTFHPRISPKSLMNLGLVFGAAGSYGIATAQYVGTLQTTPLTREMFTFFGLSWVAVWTIFFTIVIPNRPWRSLLAAIASVASVPIIIALAMKGSPQGAVTLTPPEFFFGVVFPYLLIVILAYACARLLYRLGTAVRKAREMGSYQLVDLIGKGGMGEVWRAKHRMLARPAAIKLVRPEALAGVGTQRPEFILSRFEREAQATAAMRSPHTIELYDFGISDDGVFYYVMELLDGLDLASLVRKIGALPPERVIHLLRQVCHSLAEAHDNGLIHRDIKPANVFTCRYGRDVDFVKVLDFGLVKREEHAARGDLQLTADNVTSGTPGYMAPEQILGDRPVDHRSDLYALGCLGYYLLTGQQVFDDETSMKIMMSHVQAKPVPPSELSEMEIPASLEKIIMSCLEKDPDQRIQSADLLAQRLDACELAHSWTPHRAREWWDTHHPATPAASLAEESKQRVSSQDAPTR
jgi:serine/threonine-protein kinase